jgi:GNAT superfamily N-acetyltransferase
MIRPNTDPSPAEGGGVLSATVEQATRNDVRQLGQLIADAFAELAQNLWLVPDREARPYVFPAYFALQVELGIHAGVVYTTPVRDAVAVWLPVAGAVPTLPNYDARLTQIAGRWIDRFRTFEAILGNNHPVGQPHEFLALLAVHPSRQGNGLGSRLMAHHHRLLDEQILPAYLEAANVRSAEFYRRHGWRERADAFMVAPGGPAMHPMWREPLPVNSRPRHTDFDLTAGTHP